MVKITNYLIQEGNSLICKKECVLKISLAPYTLGDNLLVKEDSVWVNSLISTVYFDDITFDIILDYPVDIQFQKLEKENGFLVFNFGPNSVILETSIDAAGIKEQIAYVKRLLSGREIVKDPTHLLSKLYDVYHKVGADIDLVHYEIVLSNLLRDSSDPTLLARLRPQYNARLLNINAVVFNESFLSGIEFERIGKAIETGLVSERPRELSPLERVLLGELV